MPAIPFFSQSTNMPQMPKGPLQMTPGGGQETDSAGNFDLLLQQEVDASENLNPLPAAFMFPLPVPAADLNLPQAGQNDAALADDNAAPDIAMQVSSPYAQMHVLDDAPQTVRAETYATPDYQLLQQQRQWQPVLQNRMSDGAIPLPAANTLVTGGTQGIPVVVSEVTDSPLPAGLLPTGNMPAQSLATGQPVTYAGPVNEAALAAEPLASLSEDTQDTRAEDATTKLIAKTRIDGEEPDTGLLEESLDAGFNEGAVDVQADKGLVDTNDLRPEQTTVHLKTENIKASNNNVQQNNAPAKFDSPLHKTPDDEVFGGQISERLVMMVKGDVQTARIQLDPPEMGALEVKIKIQHEQITVTFNSGNATVRDALEGQGNKLRDLLAQQGLTLSDMQVGSQASGQQQSQQQMASGDDSHAQGDNGPFSADASELENADNTQPLNIKVPARNSLVDQFA